MCAIKWVVLVGPLTFACSSSPSSTDANSGGSSATDGGSGGGSASGGASSGGVSSGGLASGGTGDGGSSSGSSGSGASSSGGSEAGTGGIPFNGDPSSTSNINPLGNATCPNPAIWDSVVGKTFTLVLSNTTGEVTPGTMILGPITDASPPMNDVIRPGISKRKEFVQLYDPVDRLIASGPGDAQQEDVRFCWLGSDHGTGILARQTNSFFNGSSATFTFTVE